MTSRTTNTPRTTRFNNNEGHISITPPLLTNVARRAGTNRRNGTTPQQPAGRVGTADNSNVSPHHENPFTQPNDGEEECSDFRFDDMIAALEEIEEKDADGGDSDVEGEESELHDSAQGHAVLDDDGDGNLHVKEITNGDIAMVVAKEEVMLQGDAPSAECLSELAHKQPDDWVRAPKKDASTTTPEPDFEEVDNPGGWSDFIFRPMYKKTGTGANAKYEYLGHELPTGCAPVPENTDGRRISNGYEFFTKDGRQNSLRSLGQGLQSTICSQSQGNLVWMLMSSNN